MDARVSRTLTRIREEFIALLKEKALDEITVTELCGRCGINRATFYKYYASPKDLLEKLEDERFAYLKDQMKERSCLTFPDSMTVILEDVKKDLPFYAMANRVLLPINFSNKIYNLCYESNMQVIREIFPDLPEERKVWIYRYISAGCDGIFHEWAVSGMKVSIPEVISFARDLTNTIYASELKKYSGQ